MNGQTEDPTNTNEFSAADSTGVTIIGATRAASQVAVTESEKASPGVTSSQWADDDLDESGVIDLQTTPVPGQLSLGAFGDDDDDGIDGAWMDAGDATLGEILGHIPPLAADEAPAAVAPAAVVSEPVVVSESVSDVLAPAAGSFAAQLGGRLEEIKVPLAEDDSDDDADVFPDHMYTSKSGSDVEANVDTIDIGEDTGVIVASAAATLEQRERRLAERREEDASAVPSAAATSAIVDAPAPKAARSAEGADDDRWGAFAGGAPRWRDDAKDWADVDAADASLLGDAETRVGVMKTNRSEKSDLYTLDDDGSDEDDAPAKSAPSKSAPSNVVRFDSLSRDADASGSSGGSAQRTSGRRSKQGAPSGVTGTPAAATKTGSSSSAVASPQAAQSTLSARIGTGLVLMLVVGLIFTFGKAVGAALLAAVAIAMASIELMHALRERGFRPAIPAVAVGLVAVVGAGMWRGERGVLIAIVLSVMSIACWYLFGAERERPAVNMAASLLSFGYPAMGAATAALLLHAPNGLGLLIPAIVCTVAHDVFAYAGGRLIGRTHFTDISPNKTVEGLVIGILGSVGIAALLFGKFAWAPWSSHSYPQAIALGLAVGIAAPIGDLIESLLKRDLNIKDMGNLLPGHGGVFDRIDAMMLAVPAVWLVALATNHL
jgi:phosphatidate cytidylyltransferase